MRCAYLIGFMLITGCASSATAPNAKPGTAARHASDRPLDLAIDGDGFFIVQTTAGGFLFTRHGEFSVSGAGEIVNADGYRLYPPIDVSAGSGAVSVSADGVVRREDAAGVKQLAGQIVLSRFDRPHQLDRDGEYNMPTAASGEPVTGKPGSRGLGTIAAGALEE